METYFCVACLLELALYLARDGHHAAVVGRYYHLCVFTVHHLRHLVTMSTSILQQNASPMNQREFMIKYQP